MLRKVGLFLLALFLITSIGFPQRRGEPADQGLKLNLGLLGGTAESSAWNAPRVPRPNRQQAAPQQGFLSIATVEAGSPLSRAGLRPGDRIIEAGGEQLNNNPIRVFAQQLLEASNSRLSITYLRGENERETRISCPRQDAGRALDNGIDWLVENQSEDGGWPARLSSMNGRVVVTAVAGLALMATGGHRDSVRRAATFVAEHAGISDRERRRPQSSGNWNQDNWGLSFGGVFLCEYISQHNERAIRSGLTRMVRALEENQESSGGYGHGPGGPNALNYVELEVVSNFAMAALGMADDLRIDVDRDTLDNGLRYIIDCQNPATGSVGYSTRQGQQGMDGAGRTAGALWAFRMCGRTRTEAYNKMVTYFNDRMDDIMEGHASVYTHVLSAGLAARDLGRSAWGEFYDRFEAELVMHAKTDGSFAARPSAETHQMTNNSDASHGTAWCTAVNTLILALNTRHDLETVVSSAGRERRESNEDEEDPEDDDPEDEGDGDSETDRWRRWADAQRRR